MSLEERVPEFGSRYPFPSLDTRPSAPLAVSVSWIESTALMVVVGEVDASSVGRLYRQLEEITWDLKGDLIVDMGMVSFMDSIGLAFLIATHRQLKAQGARLVVFSPSPQIRRIFQITGLTGVFTIEPFEQLARSV